MSMKGLGVQIIAALLIVGVVQSKQQCKQCQTWIEAGKEVTGYLENDKCEGRFAETMECESPTDADSCASLEISLMIDTYYDTEHMTASVYQCHTEGTDTDESLCDKLRRVSFKEQGYSFRDWECKEEICTEDGCNNKKDGQETGDNKEEEDCEKGFCSLGQVPELASLAAATIGLLQLLF